MRSIKTFKGHEGAFLLFNTTDGFHGKVLIVGAKRILQKYHPGVIFERDPLVFKQTSSNCTDHSKFWEECGYTKTISFAKFGKFSDSMENFNKKAQIHCRTLLAQSRLL